MIDRARQLADDLLFPAAEKVDRTSIPPSHFRALADAGLFSIVDLPPTEMRRVISIIGGGCGATFFVWVQHHGVLRTLAASPNEHLRDALETPMRNGDVIAGTAFAHVRRRGSRAVRASRHDGVWVLDGHAPWATSWNIAGRFCVAAESDDGRIVWSMLPGDLGACVMTTPLDLPVFAATGTVSVTFDGCRVADDDVVSVGDMAEWRSIDRRRASIGQPAVLGVTERAVRLLADAARDADDEAMATASRLEDELARLWSDDDDLVRRLADPAAGDEAVADASRHRAACLDVSRRATTALLAAVGGAGMDLGHPAQRLAREATFYVIQAQTIDGRNATLRSV